MLDKILNMFFVKTKKEKSNKAMTIKRRIDSYLVSEKKLENNIQTKDVKTCLSGYFVNRRGLNLIERGFTYSLMKEVHNR